MDVRSILTISLAIRIYNMISAVEKKRKKCYDALIKESETSFVMISLISKTDKCNNRNI